MKTKIISIVVMLLMACNVMAQDYMTVYFKDGTDRKFYLKDIATIATKKQDAEGKQHGDYEYQHITTHHNKYVYNLNEVDSITFSSIDEEAAERNFVAAMPEVFSAISDCNTIDDAEKLVDQINAIDGVGEAWTDGHALNVLIKEGETYSFDFGHENLVADSTLLNQLRAMAPQLKSKAELDNFTPSVAIAVQTRYDEIMDNDRFLCSALELILRSCGIDFHQENPTVSFLYDNSHVPDIMNMYDYDYVLLVTHGNYMQYKYYDNGKIGYGAKCHQFLTSDELFSSDYKGKEADDKPDWLENYQKFNDWRNKYPDATDKYISYTFHKELRGGQWKWIAYPIVTDFFFKDYAQGLFKNNSLLFNSACRSMKGNYDMANIFRMRRNLGTYMGYTESNYSGFNAGSILLSNMAQGYSFEQSYNAIPAWAKKETSQNFIDYNIPPPSDLEGAELIMIPEENSELLGTFFNSPVTLDVKASEANQEWIETGKVTATGALSVSTIQPEITTGIEYGLDPNNLDKRVSASMVGHPWNGQNYFTFDGSLTGLVGGNLYHYRAYSFDGLHYNYGPKKEFLLRSDIITLAQHELVLQAGNSGVVSIEKGSGDYSCTVNEANIVSAEISGGEVIVKSHVPGEAIVTVTDNGLGQATKLKVSVIYAGERCPDEHHPHMIDLGLPSGTLWSCCNVGSLSPEGSGNHYAWGETEEKSECVEDNYYYRNYLADLYSDLGDDIAATIYDAANMQWSSLWQMPSQQQAQELIDNCTWEQVVQNDVKGYRVTSSNGASVFFPYAGVKAGNSIDSEGFYGGYWTSSINNDNLTNAWRLMLTSFYAVPMILDDVRYAGWSVRPVCTGLPSTVLRVDRNDVELNVGDRTSIVITSGSGNYSIHNSNEIALWASLDNGTVALEGLKGGDAVVTLTDITTKQSTEITVSVLGDEEPVQTETFTVNGVSFTMVAVEGGTFMMGASESDPDVFDGERPQHQVTLSSYSIGQTEVTQELWKAVMGDNPSSFTGSANLPVEQVSWYDCQEFITKLNKLTGRTFSLPTDAEWEFAARGGNRSKGYKYSGSNNIDNVAWYKDNSGNKTNVVATKSPNELGLYDMSGNVWEWCHDFYSKYSDEAQTNPIGNIPNDQRGMHGGSWNFNSSFCRVCHRNRDVADHTASHLGFRLALSSLEKPTTWNVSAEAIDLGLPSGTLWASCNVGASTPEEYGDYYSWGEVSTKDSYDWNTYKYYVYETGSAKNLGEDIAGTKYDVAHLKWGGLWRMPSKEQIQELIDNCTCTTRIQNGVEGVLVKGPNGKTIFLPYAGFMFLGAQTNADSRGYYWSSTQWYYSSSAFSLDIEYGVNDWALSYRERSIGYTVRPVMPDGNLRISKNSVDLNLGTGTTIEILTGSGNYSVSVDKPAIATASLSDNIITIDGVALGSAVVTLKDHDYGKTAEINVKVSSSSEEYPIAEAVDLGLFSGTLWASWNVGASAPEDCGGYYAWGETEAKDNYVRDSYEYYNSAFGRWIEIGDDIAGTEYDVAHVRWGGSWTMPTDEQIRELMDDCTREFTTRNGVSGYLITGRNGNSIFLPAAGYMSGDEKLYSNYEGRYWSSIQQALNHAAEVRFSDRSWNLYNSYKPYGLCVRAVITPAERPPLPLSCPDDNHPHVIDLGLPSGTKWACCNVGSTRPESSGGYYAWGESAMKDSYDWSNYVHCDGTEYTCHDIGRDIAGTEYDVAHVKWGGSWQMPSVDQFNEMLSYCSGSWTQHNGVDGVIVIGPNGNAIFLPAVGYVYGGYLYESESSGRYWASTRYPYSKAMAYNLKFSSSSWSYQNTSEVIYGFPVRPICP